MIKVVKILLLCIVLLWRVAGHKVEDDAEESRDDEYCLVDAVGAGFPVTYSTIWDINHFKPILNKC